MNDLQVTRTPEMVAAEINLIMDQTRKLVLSNSILIGKKLKEVKEALELKVEIWAVLNGINKLLEHLDKVQDGKRGAGVCKALASALAQSQNQITKRLEKFEQEA